MRTTIYPLLATACLAGWSGMAQVPGILSHQGKLTVSGTNFTGTGQFKFALVTTNGAGSDWTLWSHDGTSVNGSEPTGSAVSLSVARGVFSVNLGDTSVPNMAQAIPGSLFTNREVYLRVWFNDGVNGSQRLSPDRRLTAVGYALMAGSVFGTVPAATNFTGLLAGDVTGPQGATVVGTVGGVSAANVASGANAANAATNANTPSTIVKRNASGDFTAGTITATFAGNGAALTNLTATNLLGTAPSATNFTAPLSGDVAGPQGATVVGTVGGVSAANVASGANLANAATNVNTPNVIVKRNANGDFTAGTITATFVGNGSALTNLTATNLVGTAPSATNFTAPLAGDVAGPQGATVVGTVGGVSAANLATGANAANSATNANTPGAIVRRDNCDGNFAAGTITATGRFIGDGSGLTNLPTSPNQYGAPVGAMLASVVAQDPVLLAGGYRQIMSFSSPGWVNGATANAPSARSGHTAVWDGQRMIVWGGTVGNNAYTASGGMYDANADAWTTTSTVGAPSARCGHTAVWTGSAMVVWGGQNASAKLGTGGKYVPGGSWSAVATSGAPSERIGHVAVWTGSFMIVWGGLNSSGLLDDGALYDPSLNQWTALSIPNPPDPRFGAVAVWAGDRMLVWGGQGDLGDLDTGGQLLFSGGAPSQWVALPQANAPSARSGHSAVWAVDRMIVWGGESGGLGLGDGAAYCPSCGQWQTVAAANAPAPRYDYAALWTSTEMLVVDGANSAGEISSGSAYDPVSQEWRALSAVGGPLARTGATAVWTDTEVMVFGGQAAGQRLATLQRLTPQPAWYFYRKL